MTGDIPLRIRRNFELEKLCKDLNTGNFIKLQRRGWIGWKMQGTPGKYTKPTYNKNGLRKDPSLDGCRNDIRNMEIINWR